MNPAQQIWTIARLELSRVFFSRRSFWVYLLAIFPSVIFLGHAVEATIQKRSWSARGTVSAEALNRVQSGMTDEQVLESLGKPVNDNTRRSRPRRNRDEDPEAEKQPEVRRYMMYFDGKRRVDLRF